MKTTFTQDWKDWITTNVNSGQNKDGLFKILLDEGYDMIAIAQEMKYVPSVPVDQLVNPFDVAKREQGHNVVAQSDPHSRNKTIFEQIDLNDIFIPNADKSDTEQIELYSLDDFLNNRECESILEIFTSEYLKAKKTSPAEKENLLPVYPCEFPLNQRNKLITCHKLLFELMMRS